MVMFRVGQSVVCKEKINGLITDGYAKGSFSRNIPKKGEVVTVSGIYNNGDIVTIQEYPIGVDNIPQGFKSYFFEPIQLDYNFVDEVIKKIIPQEEMV